MGTPSHLGHMDRVAATMPSQAHAGAAQEAPDIGQWEGQDVPLVRPSSCNVKGGIPSSRRYLPTYLYHMQQLLVCLFHTMQPFTHPPILNTVIVQVSHNTLAPIVVVVMCLGHHSSGLVLNPRCGLFLYHVLRPANILGELKGF